MSPKIFKKNEDRNYQDIFDEDIKLFFSKALKLGIKNPMLLPYLTRTYFNQMKAASIRKKQRESGEIIPPVMIFSITDECNLNCKGCYSQAQHRTAGKGMSRNDINRLFNEAREIGISIILTAGGEPFTRKDLLNITGDHPDIIFPVFTNGLLIDKETAEKISKHRNLIPVLSIEGLERQTDERRGEGVFDAIHRTIPLLEQNNIFWGISITVTRENYDLITGNNFLRELIFFGGRLFFFVEYVPIKEETINLVPTDEQRDKLKRMASELSAKHPALFVVLPGDEASYGGCLAAGRGFIHISANGDVEPCPFAPYSDINIKNRSLKDAINSSILLTKIRENHDSLTESQGGCALWTNREWVRTLIK
jgi:MoaA/NifB/PqqE/SkfB family radical SAM enzyme